MGKFLSNQMAWPGMAMPTPRGRCVSPPHPRPVQEVSCSLNFDSHTGRGKLSLANPRYSGLRGDNLSGGFRWERDVVRLEKLVLQQQRSRCGTLYGLLPAGLLCGYPLACCCSCQVADHGSSAYLPRLACRYEVQGEYTIPPNTPLPSSAAELALQPPPANSAVVAAPAGRWRLQVAVPSAELQEIIPAARLLQSATSLSPAEYERAKAAFLQASPAAGVVGVAMGPRMRTVVTGARGCIACTSV